MKEWMRGAILALGVGCAVSAAPAASQSVESIMGARERLELTEEQLEALEALRRELVERRVQEMAEMTELRSRLRAGEIRRSDVMAALEDRGEGARALAEATRGRIDAILTVEQRETLDERRTRPARLRADIRRGRPGVRGGRLGPRRPQGVRALGRAPREPRGLRLR